MPTGVLSIRRISIRRIPIIGLGLGLGIAFGELKFGELKRNHAHDTSTLQRDRRTTYDSNTALVLVHRAVTTMFSVTLRSFDLFLIWEKFEK